MAFNAPANSASGLIAGVRVGASPISSSPFSLSVVWMEVNSLALRFFAAEFVDEVSGATGDFDFPLRFDLDGPGGMMGM